MAFVLQITESVVNHQAWDRLKTWDVPCGTCFADNRECGGSPGIRWVKNMGCTMGRLLFYRQQECGESAGIGQTEDRLYRVQHGALQHGN